MRDVKYIKACPFLRDLGDSYLCINQDDVIDVLLDPLIDIEWSDDITPVASEVEDYETCLFILEKKEDEKLYCISRKMFLSMDKREILWSDIRDAIYLLQLDDDSSFSESQIDFCSNCLYKVLLASSPAFQKKLSVREKIRLGTSYILNRANEIYTTLRLLSLNINKELVATIDTTGETEKEFDKSAFHWILWIAHNRKFDDEFIATTINWIQKFDEWNLLVSKIADSISEEEKIRQIEQSYNYAAKLKETSYDLVVKLTCLEDKDDLLNTIEKIFTRASIFFEDFMFISNQFLKNIKTIEE